MTDAAAEPLISHDREDERRSEDDARDEEEDVDESALLAPGRFIWGLTVCVGVSGLLFGYEYVTSCEAFRRDTADVLTPRPAPA
jgi:SP family myo-inositol transporter-like MFS transporter 13